jgi:hypothetical protein
MHAVRTTGEQRVQRWHGRIGDATTGDAVCRYRLRLHATPLDERDAAAVQARLGTPDWALERVTSILVHGFWPGDGQLWTPDPRARISVLDAPPASRDGMPSLCFLAVETTLTRDALTKRLLQAFARERLIGIEIDDAFDVLS